MKKTLYCTHTSNRMVPGLCLAWYKVSFGAAPKLIPPRSSYAFLFASCIHREGGIVGAMQSIIRMTTNASRHVITYWIYFMLYNQ